MLGHRRRLLLDTVAEHVVQTSARMGHSVTFFAYLENGTMQTPYITNGAELHAHPRFRDLSDAALRLALSSRVREAGGSVDSILIDHAPAAAFPIANTLQWQAFNNWSNWRMFEYKYSVRKQVPPMQPCLPAPGPRFRPSNIWLHSRSTADSRICRRFSTQVALTLKKELIMFHLSSRRTNAVSRRTTTGGCCYVKMPTSLRRSISPPSLRVLCMAGAAPAVCSVRLESALCPTSAR